MIVVGIDPGQKGGIVANRYGEIISTRKMPVVKFDGYSTLDYQAIAHFLHDMQPDHVVIEKVHSMPGQGVKSMFSFGMGFGGLLGVCAALGLPLTLVRPQVWQKRVCGGIDKDAGKKRGILYCKQRFPQCEPLHSHDGLADAACMTVWFYQAESHEKRG